MNGKWLGNSFPLGSSSLAIEVAGSAMADGEVGRRSR